MPANWRGIDYVEHVPGSPLEVLENDNVRVQRIFDCDWTDRQTFADKLLGYPEIKTSSGGVKYISRLTPHFHEDFLNASGQKWIFATKVTRIEGIGFRSKSSEDIAAYETARLTLMYESVTYEVLEDADVKIADVPDESSLRRYVTRTLRPYSEFLTTRPGTLKWVPDAAPMNFGAAAATVYAPGDLHLAPNSRSQPALVQHLSGPGHGEQRHVCRLQRRDPAAALGRHRARAARLLATGLSTWSTT